MSSLATALGLSATGLHSHQPPSYGAHYMIFHFIWAYVVLSSRAWKIHYKLDHNVSPRDDLIKYGPIAVQKGKITQPLLDQIRRVENCHANSVEHYTVFVAAIIFAHVAGVDNAAINRVGLSYTVARVLYSASYIFNGNERLALARGVFWWASNIICIRAFWLAGKVMNAKLV
ncbi:hypothetical protein CLAFUW4_07873 [Fulvia fulva]|uniref:Uncharacterized protein n=1 Tax=Passalora fulva TaxID=5499 RepID=A0A9Q8LD52_PASFU|nr:uncharacterized protein CLAFUR5_07998 [Fulvia fulva]KAK4628971.1 hypothetical protein CLAFUR4_07878 [Fulvia fulva]KAK4630519.1 hypothetical protein CLAFUR0_07875 [Fulvia fulva]UJO15184.1 hypothetical protein CLAFUR5_07998 [Fulvia fulva]WPV12787.1 hypothetical protein CLAFUW4_07873 [Fulvia fulva]WPV27647.1 hypothetical protein CLAFUW7_07874 [Fulvia fulva]